MLPQKLALQIWKATFQLSWHSGICKIGKYDKNGMYKCWHGNIHMSIWQLFWSLQCCRRNRQSKIQKNPKNTDETAIKSSWLKKSLNDESMMFSIVILIRALIIIYWQTSSWVSNEIKVSWALQCFSKNWIKFPECRNSYLHLSSRKTQWFKETYPESKTILILNRILSH